MKNWWWKILAVALITYTIVGGLLFEAPRLVILNETIRVLHFHVPMWFGMIILLFISVVYSIIYLAKGGIEVDLKAVEFANVGMLFAFLGLFTGMLWANYTWGSPWSGDPKQNATAVSILIYLAYFVLRGSFKDDLQRARISSVYSIFAFACLIPLLLILPRMTDSLHPGNGGNPGFNSYDLDNKLRIVFYPAVAGWTLLGLWLVKLRVRVRKLEMKKNGIL